jgi:hypothetical protein
MTPRYFAHITAAGPVRYRQVPDAIGVLEAPDKPMPVGTAFEAGWTEGGLAGCVRGRPRRERWFPARRSCR